MLFIFYPSQQFFFEISFFPFTYLLISLQVQSMKQVLRELYYILSPNTSPGKHKILFSKQLKGPSFHLLLMFIIIYKVSQDFFFFVWITERKSLNHVCKPSASCIHPYKIHKAEQIIEEETALVDGIFLTNTTSMNSPPIHLCFLHASLFSTRQCGFLIFTILAITTEILTVLNTKSGKQSQLLSYLALHHKSVQTYIHVLYYITWQGICACTQFEMLTNALAKIKVDWLKLIWSQKLGKKISFSTISS